MLWIEANKTELAAIDHAICNLLTRDFGRTILFLTQDQYDRYYPYILSMLPSGFLRVKRREVIILTNHSELFFFIKESVDKLRRDQCGFRANEIIILGHEYHEQDYFDSLYAITLENPNVITLYYYCYDVPKYLSPAWERQLKAHENKIGDFK